MQRSETSALRDAPGGIDGSATPVARISRASALGWPQSLGRAGKYALFFAIVSGLITHGYHLFEYPLYNTDEGIYMERAWAVIREDRLSPQTYFYDHAPAGWIVLALWEFILPGHFETFANPVNSGRVLMLLVHAASVYLLFQIARRLSGGLLAPVIATFLFNFSPLGIYYQRMVLLDNIMVFWVFLSIYLLLRNQSRLFTGLWSGLTFGISVITKENAIFFAPVIFYLMFRIVRGDPNRHFAIMLWLFAACTPLLVYSLYATLKGELLPPNLDFSLSHAPQGHVSLLYELWYQINRNRGTLFDRGSYLYTMWLPKDGFLLGVGAAATAINLYRGFRDKERNLSVLVAGGLAAGIAFYLARGSIILDFYVIPLIPMFALNIGLAAHWLRKRAPVPVGKAVPAAAACVAAALMLLPSGRYMVVRGEQGQLKPNDVYYLPLTYLQQEQIAWVRAHIPPSDKIITDDDIWVSLHDTHPIYPYAESHWNAASDPRVRNKIFGANWRNINYIVLSNGMKHAMYLNNTGGQENWMLDALNYHSTKVWQASRGKVQLSIYRVTG
jgi:4-amino-4-deoxy-L-arabinose transferase-like glycosyltransferase